MAAPSRYTWHRCRLQNAQGSSVVVVRASDNQGSVFLGLRQVWKLFSSPSLSYGSFSARAAQTGKLYPTNPMDRTLMFRLGAVGTHASAAKLVSLTAAIRTLRWFSCPASMQDRLRLLRQLETCQLVGDEAHLLMLNQAPELTPLEPVPSQPLPLTLPPCLLSVHQRAQRHGLLSTARHLINQFPLKQQMQELKAWSKRLIQLDSDGIAIRTRTWQGIEKEVYLYLGFIHAYHSIQMPNLRHFLDAPLLAAYLSYHQAAEHAYNTINNVFSAIKRVIAWLKLQTGVEAGTMQALQAWVVRLHKQVRQSMARDKLNVTALAETNNWCTAAHLAGIMAGARESVLNELRDSPMTLPLARRLHDALLGCFMFGWLPPQRPSCVRTLLSPFYRGPCMDPDCRKPQECQGNRILRHADGHERGAQASQKCQQVGWQGHLLPSPSRSGVHGEPACQGGAGLAQTDKR